MHARRAELRGRGGHGEIAGGDELASGRRGGRFHRRDHRLRQPQDRKHQGAAALHDVAGVAASAGRVGAVRGQFLEVMARGERGSVRCKHHRANALISGETIELARQVSQHRLGQAVAGLRAVERENGYVADRLPQQRRLARGRGRFGASGGVSCHRLGPENLTSTT